MKTAVVAFFDVYPPKSGSSVVIYDFFNSWPNSQKCLFQMSQNNVYKKNIISIKIIKNKPIFKIISLCLVIFRLINYFSGSKKKILIIEGASWIFYSYVVIFFLKRLFSDITIIYRSHNIEYEIRKKNSSFFISFITKYFEKKVFKISDVATSVSKLEQKKIHQYYGVSAKLFPNSIRVKDFIKLKEKKIKNFPKRYILYCGSYEYRPNKFAINYLINKILPAINPKEEIYLALTGSPSNVNFNNNRVINLHYVQRSELKFLYKNAICLMVPLFEGYGTRIKILEALVLNANVISTSKGIEGIDYSGNEKIIVTNALKKMIEGIYHFMKFKKNKNKSFFTNVIKYYSMEDNTKKLFENIK